MPNRQKLSKAKARAQRKRARCEAAKVSPIAVANSSKSTGRPRKDGDRYANGRLKPIEPNQTIVKRREALMGGNGWRKHELRAAENPLDLMRARGWIAPGLHVSAEAYTTLWRRAYPGIGAVRCVDPGGAGGGGAPNDGVGDLDAIAELQDLAAAIPGQQTSLLFDVCVLRRWPEWLLGMTVVRDLAPRLADDRKKFMAALQRLDTWLDSPRQ